MRDSLPRRAPPAVARPVGRRAKRVKLRARELARLQCHNLELDIMNLRQEIASLTTLRSLLYARTLHRPDDVHGRFEKVVREFYALNTEGYRDVLWRPNGACVDVRRFMRSHFDAAMAIDMTGVSSHSGLHAFLTMIASNASMLGSTITIFDVTVLADGDEVTVVVTSQCTSFLTRARLDSVFPDLKDSAPWLCERLVGRELVTPCKGRFTFDLNKRLVVKVDLRGDAVSPIERLVETVDKHEILWSEVSPASGLEGPRVLEERERTKPTASASSMSLERLLSPEREADDEQEERCYAVSA